MEGDDKCCAKLIIKNQVGTPVHLLSHAFLPSINLWLFEGYMCKRSQRDQWGTQLFGGNKLSHI